MTLHDHATQQESIACRILYSTQSGRSKACARRTARIINDHNKTMANNNYRRILLQNGQGTTFDDALLDASVLTIEDFVRYIKESSTTSSTCLLICFVSTTGDGEHTDTIQHFWKQLLQKSLSNNLFHGISVAIFSLGDRCYGPDKYCAAGRKLMIRLVRQLGAALFVQPGYGDDGTSNGGVFIDLDNWLYKALLPKLFPFVDVSINNNIDEKSGNDKPPNASLYDVKINVYSFAHVGTDNTLTTGEEWQHQTYSTSYMDFFDRQRPSNAYCYCYRSESSEISRISSDSVRRDENNDVIKPTILLGRVIENRRITADYWHQNTRHILLDVSTYVSGTAISSGKNTEHYSTSANGSRISIDQDIASTRSSDYSDWDLDQLPYRAGDVAVIMPSNTLQEVTSFLNVLPVKLQQLADCELSINYKNEKNLESFTFPGIGYKFWPSKCTFRGFLTYCADIHALPEREDLRALASYCSPNGQHQRDKLISLSETKDSALYVDYIIREKRSWVHVLYDFDSLRDEGSQLTIEGILGLMLPIRPRLFSIASSPTRDWMKRKDKPSNTSSFSIELCVAVVEGTTRLGRKFHGLCSNYLRLIEPICTNKADRVVRLWIQPGSFHGLPLALQNGSVYTSPILCIGAGTGIAPLRSIIEEREAVWNISRRVFTANATGHLQNNIQHTLVFGCRKKDADFYYEDEWTSISKSGRMMLLTAFSQDQLNKIYVQQVLASESFGLTRIVKHLLDDNGAIYVAGGPKMAKAVNDVIIEALVQHVSFADEKGARKTLSKLQSLGLYCVEAWS